MQAVRSRHFACFFTDGGAKLGNDKIDSAGDFDREEQPVDPASLAGGCLGLLLVFGIVSLLFNCGGSETSEKSPEEIAAETAERAENRRKGFHCLSGWDGANRSLVQQVTSGLRDPDSFEHVDTLITPVGGEEGKHGITMTYRAKNGFGGTNLGRALAQVDPETCAASSVLVAD